MHCIKIHRSYRSIVAVCDSNLLGKKFEEDIRQLDIRENFYNGKNIEKEELIRTIIKELKEDATFNIVGKDSVNAALEAGVIDKSCIAEIHGIPFALKLL